MRASAQLLGGEFGEPTLDEVSQLLLVGVKFSAAWRLEVPARLQS
jgi:hypothetical protein